MTQQAVAPPDRPLPPLRVRMRRKLAALRTRWQTSLSLRTVVFTLLGGLVAMTLLGWYVAVQIRDGLFDSRVQALLQDAAVQTEDAQDQLDSSPAQTGQQVQGIANSVVENIQTRSSGAVGAALLRSPQETSQVTIIEPGVTGVRDLVTDAMRDAVAGGGHQYWQPVAIPTPGARTEPGIVVGAPVNLPAAGAHELYIVYSLAPEEDTIGLVMRILGVAAAALVAVLVALAWFFTWRVLRPVRQAATTAERIAAGMLSERMTVRGRDELATLARSFNEMTSSLERQIERLEELSRLQQRFVSDVSHELRTPLTTIRMAGEMLHDRREDFDPVARRAAELLYTQIDRFESMLADLLEISRFDAGAAVLETEQRDVRDLVTGVVDLTAPLADAKRTTVRVHAGEAPCTAEVDPRRVERILRNLLVNALEHGDGHPVDITIGCDDDAVAVVVRDHGVGMTPEAASRVFDRFWRADPARARTTGGTGLGLSIALEDARLHGGRLEAWGEPGAGAAFRLTLPRRAGVVLEGSPLPLVSAPAEEGVH